MAKAENKHSSNGNSPESKEFSLGEMIQGWGKLRRFKRSRIFSSDSGEHPGLSLKALRHAPGSLRSFPWPAGLDLALRRPEKCPGGEA